MSPSCSEAMSPLSMAHLSVLENCKLLTQRLQTWANQKTPNHTIKAELRVCERCVGYWGFPADRGKRG